MPQGADTERLLFYFNPSNIPTYLYTVVLLNPHTLASSLTFNDTGETV